MKFFHLSDLHIGKRVYEFSMLEDQKYILEQIVAIAEAECPDGVILAGDLYDKPVPPAEAVMVLDTFLTRLAKMNIPVLIISGNHDSAQRLAFGASLMSSRGIYISPVYDGEVKKICLRDSWGEVWVYLLPFLKPALVRHAFEQEEVESYQDALALAIGRMDVDTKKRNVLVAHQFVTGASRCESEEVTVGGLDQVGVSLFDIFDYVALGHLHSPQQIGRETVRYCGTPLKYSFSEVNQEKSITVTELLEKGTVHVRQIPLKPLRDMRKIRGSYLEVTAKSFYDGTNTEDYVQITLTDEEDILDGLQKLRVIYPNLMRLEYDNRRTKESKDITGTSQVEQKTQLELFEEFYRLQNNQSMSRQQSEFIKRLFEQVRQEEET